MYQHTLSLISPSLLKEKGLWNNSVSLSTRTCTNTPSAFFLPLSWKSLTTRVRLQIFSDCLKSQSIIGNIALDTEAPEALYSTQQYLITPQEKQAFCQNGQEPIQTS